MNILLIFFALPLATIIISIALQKLLKNPALVASIIFAIFLVVTFIIDNLNFLVATIVYTIISFITATIVFLICKIIRRLNNDGNNNDDSEETQSTSTDEFTTFETFNNTTNNCNTNSNNSFNARISVIPNVEYRGYKKR